MTASITGFPRTVAIAAADQLAIVRAALDVLGENLCADPAVAGRHMVDLQTIDAATQTLAAIEHVLRHPCTQSAIAEVTLEKTARALSSAAAVGH